MSAVREYECANAGRDDATGNTHDPKDAEVAVPHGMIRRRKPDRGRDAHHSRRRFAAVLWLGAFIGASRS